MHCKIRLHWCSWVHQRTQIPCKAWMHLEACLCWGFREYYDIWVHCRLLRHLETWRLAVEGITFRIYKFQVLFPSPGALCLQTRIEGTLWQTTPSYPTSPLASIYTGPLVAKSLWISAGSPILLRSLLVTEVLLQGPGLKYLLHPGPFQFLHLLSHLCCIGLRQLDTK